MHLLRRSLSALFATAMVLGWPLLANGNRDPGGWPFRVTPDGRPDISVQLFKFTEAGRLSGIHVRHDLVFDGLRYASRLCLPELESILLPARKGEFLWRAPSGATMLLRMDGARANRDRQSWSVQIADKDRLTVSRADGLEIFEYQAGRLAAARWGPDAIRLELDAAGRFGRLFGRNDQVLLTATFEGDRLKELTDGTKRLSFGFEDGRLAACTDMTLQSMIFKCEYDNAMLSEFAQGRASASFRWGLPVFGEHYNLENPLPPVVIDDGAHGYRVSFNRLATKVTFHAIGSREPQNGEWRLGIGPGGAPTVSLRLRSAGSRDFWSIFSSFPKGMSKQ